MVHSERKRVMTQRGSLGGAERHHMASRHVRESTEVIDKTSVKNLLPRIHRCKTEQNNGQSVFSFEYLIGWQGRVPFCGLLLQFGSFLRFAAVVVGLLWLLSLLQQDGPLLLSLERWWKCTNDERKSWDFYIRTEADGTVYIYQNIRTDLFIYGTETNHLVPLWRVSWKKLVVVIH